MDKRLQLKSTIKYPTSLIVNGVTPLGLQIAEALMEQGGYVVLIDTYNDQNIAKIMEHIGEQMLFSFLDYSSIPHLEEDLRRLDYVFYLNHDSIDLAKEVSTQTFLKYSNYLDTALALAVKFEAKFLLTTSVRAHQMLLTNMDMEVNYGKSADRKHSVYTEMEVQRYAESLVAEYGTRANLNSRVVRLGELIGGDIDLSVKSPFTSLVNSAVQGNELELANDGLEEGWYVHTADAAYGIIKAQFSKETDKQIFTLAYESPITTLSLAYKVQELEPGAREISFAQDTKGLLPLRLYKAAPNLVHIGWKPRQQLEEAIRESIAQAKLTMVHAAKPADRNVDVLNKLKSFIHVSQSTDVINSDDLGSGPIARLVAERRRQEEARDAALTYADSKVKAHKKPQRSLSIYERMNRWVWRNFFDPVTSFGPLRRMTVIEVAFYGLLLVAFLVAYFAVISPLIVIGRNVVLIATSSQALNTAYHDLNPSEVRAEAERLQFAFSETAEMLGRFTGVAETIALKDQLASLTDTMQVYAGFMEGVRNVAYAAEPLSEYLDKYTDNLRFRASDDSYLAVSAGVDYSSILDELELRRAYAEIGGEQVAQARANLMSRTTIALPAPLAKVYTDYRTQILALDNIQGLVGAAEYAADAFGARVPRSYVIFLTDNSKPMPLGGELVAYLQFTWQNGSIADVKLQSIDKFGFDPAALPQYAKDEINSRSFAAKSSISVGDLAYLGEIDVFSSVVKELWGTKQGKQVDIIGIANLESVAKLLLVTGAVEVEGREFGASNLLSATAEATTDSAAATVERRHDLLTQVWATALDKLFDNWEGNIFELMPQLAAAASEKQLIVAKPTAGVLTDLVESADLSGDLVMDLPLYISPFWVREPATVSPTKYPSYTQNVQILVNADSSMSVRYLVRFPSVDNVTEMGVCLPRTAISLAVASIPSSRQSKREEANQQCLVVDVLGETELLFTWSTLQFESSEQTQYNLGVGLAKPAGSQVTTSIEIELATGLSLSQIAPPVETINGKLALTLDLGMDQAILFKVNRN
jgi:nucleoside-diphosphate-sugar epimerase